MPFDTVVEAIRRERTYQDKKWGALQDNPHTLLEWLAIVRRELEEADVAWLSADDDNCQRELLQVATVIVACLEQHGVMER